MVDDSFGGERSLYPVTMASTRTAATPDDGESSRTDEVLALLEDTYSRTILEAIHATPKPVRDLVETCNASRATVYRRLDRLEAAGLVESWLTYDADGHHRTVYEASLSAVTVDLDADGIALSVATGDDGTEPVTGD